VAAVRDRLTELGDAEVAVVTFTRPRNLRGFRARYADPLTVLADEGRDVYRAYGFEIAAEPTDQQGGDIVIGRDGRVALLHRSKASDDRPPVDELIAAVSGGGDKIER
jgi:peroxiredoxin